MNLGQNLIKFLQTSVCAIVVIVSITPLSGQQKNYFYERNHKISSSSLLENHNQNQLKFNQESFFASDPLWDKQFTIPGVDGTVYALAASGTDLYVGGSFTVAGHAVANNIARWDGTEWHSVGTGEENGVGGTVQSIAVLNGKLYVGGMFTKVGKNLDANGVASWDGIKWSSLGIGAENGLRFASTDFSGNPAISMGHGYSLLAKDSLLFVGGFFNRAGTAHAQGLAVWNDNQSTWSDVGGSIRNEDTLNPAYAYAMVIKDDILYIGGKFTRAGSTPAKGFAAWDYSKQQWSEVGGGVTGRIPWIRQITVAPNGNLVVVGKFDSVGTPAKLANGLAKWNGRSWETMNFFPESIQGPGTIPDVRAALYRGNDLYIGGGFRIVDANGDTAKALAKWDGTNWTKVGNMEFEFNSQIWGAITSLAIVTSGLEARIYAAGEMSKADDRFVSNIASYSPTSFIDFGWKALVDYQGGMGLYPDFNFPEVRAISTIDDTSVVVGGSFSIVGGASYRSIVKWNGAMKQWEGLAEGIDGEINTIAVDRKTNEIFVGGYFGKAGTEVAYHIARWDGLQWHSVGIGVGGVRNPSVDAIAIRGDTVYVGGRFAVVGDSINPLISANSIARWIRSKGQWDTLGLGGGVRIANDPSLTIVKSISFDENGQMVVGGMFDQAGSAYAYNVASWDGKSWNSIGFDIENGVNGEVISVTHFKGNLIVGGSFTSAGASNASCLAEWNGVNWAEFGGGVGYDKNNWESPMVFYLKGDKEKLIVSGWFNKTGDVYANNIAAWNGSNWSALGDGTNSTVLSTEITNDGIYEGGLFSVAGGAPSVAFAKWRGKIVSDVRESSSKTPSDFILLQNYPNPFNPTTTMQFTIPTSGKVSLKVYNMLGQVVSVLLDGFVKEGINHQIEFDGTKLASGTYFSVLEFSGKRLVKKMLLLK